MSGSTELSWVFELYDKVSKPAAGMADKVGAAEKAMIASAAATARLVQQLDHAGPAAKHAAEGHGAFLSKLHDVVELAYEAPKVIGEIWEKAKEFGGEIINGMRFKQDNLIALEALRGTREAAIEVFEGVEDFAFKTGQKVADVMRVTKDLVASGFDNEEIETFRLLLGDLRIIDPGKADAVAVALGEIGRRGFMTERQMRGLSNAGIDLTRIWEALSKETHYSVAALQKMEGLKIRAGTAKGLIQEVLLGKYSGGVAGSLVEKEMKTLPVALDRLKMIPERIIDTLAGFEGGAGGGAFEKIVTNIADAFDPAGETGKRIVANLRGFIDTVGQAFGLSGPGGLFAELAGANGAKKVEELVNRMIGWFKDGIPTFVAFANAARSIADAIVTIGNTLNGSAGDRIYKLLHPQEFNAGLGTIPEQVEIAKRTIADPNASDASREYARKILNQASVTVIVQGNATKEDAEHIGKTSAEAVGAALEQHAIQAGGM